MADAAEFVAVAVAMGRGFWEAAAMTSTPSPAASPSQLADQLDAMLARGTHPQLVGQWVATNQGALLAMLRVAAYPLTANALNNGVQNAAPFQAGHQNW